MRVRRLSLIWAVLLTLVSVGRSQTLFQSHSYSVPGDRYFSVHDMNKDGSPDIVLFGGSLAVLFNNGHGAFGSPRVIPNASAVFAAIGDFNGDGLPDLVGCKELAGAGAAIAVYMNQGGGSFKPGYTTSIPDTCESVITADINRDGKTDFIVASYGGTTTNPTSTLRTYFGNGAGGFHAPVVQQISVAAKKDPQDIVNCVLGGAVGSTFATSQRTDLFLMGTCETSATSAGTLYYATSRANGTYSLTEISENNLSSCADSRPYVTDLNADGKPDVVLRCSETAPDNTYLESILEMVNRGSGKFVAEAIAFEDCLPVGQYCDTLPSGGGADFTGDHVFDSVYAYDHTPDPPRFQPNHELSW